MKKTILLLSLCFLWASNLVAQQTNSQIIIKLKSDSKLSIEPTKQVFNHTSLDSINDVFSLKSIKLTGNQENTYLLNFESSNINSLIKFYQKTNLFEYVEANFTGKGAGVQSETSIIPNDTYFSRQYAFYNDGTFSLSPAKEDADIVMDLAWDIEQGDESIIVAVLDAGAKLDHPEFSGRIWKNTQEIPNNGLDDDNNGYIDDVDGWDWANNDNDPTDDHGHGTNVAGIIGANSDNDLGYAGVDWNCKLMICKVLDNNNSGFYSWWTSAIYYAVDNGADVINMSLGGSSFSQSMEDAIDYAHENGVVVVASMMNFNNGNNYYPAAYTNTIAVGSTNPNDERTAPFFWSTTSGSNYGQHIDVVAPGNYTYGLSYSSNTNYGSYWGGTSQSAPMVAGLSSLLLAQNPSRTPDEIRAIIRNTAEDQVGKPSEDIEGFDIYHGYGRVNAHQALLQDKLTSTFTIKDSDAFVSLTNNQLLINSNIEYQTVSIHNLLGNEVYKQEGNSSTINVSNLQQGMYIISLVDANGKVVLREKVLKK
ncbi:MAG: S8 family serine peptidase [Cytophagales bacterium]|nr:S8 family serine peptidase [Cytophagales bacterium]